nr:hypothetical protein [Tanacetum cinerariifolium]
YWESKNWLVQKQTALGKDKLNPLMADNLPKIVWYSTHHITLMKSWLVQKQMALGQTTTGKEILNPFIDETPLFEGMLVAEEIEEQSDAEEQIQSDDNDAQGADADAS